MAEFDAGRIFFTKRAVVIAVIVVAAGAAAGVAEATSAGRGSPALSPGEGGPVATAPVVRTDLIIPVQVGGSIGYQGSYTVTAPSGASAPTVSAAQQTVTADQQTLSADEQAGSDASAAGSQAVAAAQATVSTGQSALSVDEAAERRDCAGAGASSAACRQDTQKVSTDQAQLTEARQQLAAAEVTAKTGDDQAQGKVGADQVKLRADQATLASLLPAAANPGTTYTWLPQTGAVIRQDQPVYSVNDEPVPLLYGPIAAYRAFYTGMPDGGDVGELTRDLITLGYGGGLTQSDSYSQATATAVERWQRARGLPATGQVLLGEVVFEPGPIRVTSVTVSPGASTGGGGGASSGGGGGTVLTATGTAPVVTVDLSVTQEYLVKPGDSVSVVLPDGTTTVGGHVESVGTVATCPGGTGTDTGSGSAGAGGSPCSGAGSNGGSGSNSTPTVTVTVTLDSTPAGARLDQAPVNVNITSQTVRNVLAVPVNALLALAGGGYGVDVVTGGTSRLTGVTTGLDTGTLVQVSGPGITAGTRVEVPSS